MLRLTKSLKQQILKKSFATESTTGKLVVNFTAPYKAYVENKVLNQVNLSTTDGDMGILAGHVPVVLELLPSVISLIGPQETLKFFVSGGFAIVNPDSSLNINAVEAVLLQDIDQELAKRSLDEISKTVASKSTPQETAEAQIQVKVLEAVVAAGKT